MRLLWPLLVVVVMTGCVTTESTEVQKWDPERRADAHVRLGMDYLKRGQFDTARDEFQLALETDPKSDGALHALGILELQAGNVAEAKNLMARAIRLNPKNYLAVNDYAILLCENGETDAGIARLEAIENDPGNTAILATYLGLGGCMARLERYEEARRYYRRTLDINPILPQALLPLAQISFAQDKRLSARGFLERYFSTGSVSPSALLLGVELELLMQDRERAEQYVRALRSRYPKSAEYEQARSLFY